MADQPLTLVHDETGAEYTFTDRATYLAAFYRGGYSAKHDTASRPAPAAAARPAPAAQPPARPVITDN